MNELEADIDVVLMRLGAAFDPDIHTAIVAAFQKFVIGAKSRVRRFDASQENRLQIVDEFIELVKKTP